MLNFGLPAHQCFIWGRRGIFATGFPLPSFPRFQSMNFPAAVLGLAGGALQPAFRRAVDVACQKIPAGASFRGIGLGQLRHRAPRAGVGIFPGLAGILIALGQDVGGGVAGESKIAFGRGGTGRSAPADRAPHPAVPPPPAPPAPRQTAAPRPPRELNTCYPPPPPPPPP